MAGSGAPGLNLVSHRPCPCYSDASDEKKRNEAPCFEDEGKRGKKPRTCTEILGLENDGQKHGGITEKHVGGVDKQHIQASIEGEQECKNAVMAESSKFHIKDVYRIGDRVFSTLAAYLVESQRLINEEMKEHPVDDMRWIRWDEQVEEIEEDKEWIVDSSEGEEVEEI